LGAVGPDQGQGRVELMAKGVKQDSDAHPDQ
jgi:hypothetical protein